MGLAVVRERRLIDIRRDTIAHIPRHYGELAGHRHLACVVAKASDDIVHNRRPHVLVAFVFSCATIVDAASECEHTGLTIGIDKPAIFDDNRRANGTRAIGPNGILGAHHVARQRATGDGEVHVPRERALVRADTGDGHRRDARVRVVRVRYREVDVAH